MKHRFNYAYKIICYESSAGDRIERIWNSRDGYVPMRVRDAESGEWLTLVNVEPARDDSGREIAGEQYTPKVGERILVDLTRVRARMLAVEQLDQLLDNPQNRAVIEEHFVDKEAALEEIAKKLMNPMALEGAVAADLLVVTSGYIEELLEARKQGAEPETSFEPELAQGGTRVTDADGLPMATLETGEQLTDAALEREHVPAPELSSFLHERQMYYDRQGQPLTNERYYALCEDRDYKIVERTDIGEDYVSTVWLGLDHSWSLDPGRLPVIFETMVFHKLDKPRALMSGVEITHDGREQWRYCTEAAARAGHARVVALMRAGVPLEDDAYDECEEPDEKATS